MYFRTKKGYIMGAKLIEIFTFTEQLSDGRGKSYISYVLALRLGSRMMN